MYMTLLWALPTPQTIGLDQELYQVSNCESQILSFQVTITQLRCKKVMTGQSHEFFFFWVITWALQLWCLLLDLEWCLYFEHIVESHSNACLFVSILNYKLCHIQLVYRCLIKKSEHISSTYLMWDDVHQHCVSLCCGLIAICLAATSVAYRDTFFVGV